MMFLKFINTNVFLHFQFEPRFLKINLKKTIMFFHCYIMKDYVKMEILESIYYVKIENPFCCSLYSLDMLNIKVQYVREYPNKSSNIGV